MADKNPLEIPTLSFIWCQVTQFPAEYKAIGQENNTDEPNSIAHSKLR